MEPPLTIEVRSVGLETTLAVTGEIDLTTCTSLTTAFEHLDPRCRRIYLDLQGVTFFDSTGISILLNTVRRFGPELRELTIVNPSEVVRRVLEVAGVLDVLTPAS